MTDDDTYYAIISLDPRPLSCIFFNVACLPSISASLKDMEWPGNEAIPPHDCVAIIL